MTRRAGVRRFAPGRAWRPDQLRAMFWRMAHGGAPGTSSGVGTFVRHPLRQTQLAYRKFSKSHPTATEFGSLLPIIGTGILAERGLGRFGAWRTATKTLGREVVAASALYTPIVVGWNRVLHGPIQYHHGGGARRFRTRGRKGRLARAVGMVTGD